jgi:hypothetical protein
MRSEILDQRREVHPELLVRDGIPAVSAVRRSVVVDAKGEVDGWNEQKAASKKMHI